MKSKIASPDFGDTSAFFVADLSVVASRLAEFRSALPRVTPFYAVKCNPDLTVMRTLSKLGCGFDCASQSEMELARDCIPDAELGDRVVFANPQKMEEHLAYASQHGVRLMTFDSVDELHKIHRLCPAARTLLRIAVEDSKSLVPLSTKFGALHAEVPSLLGAASLLGISVVGLAFHVGSGCPSLTPFMDALELARRVFDDAASMGLQPMSVLDIGGGFPGHDVEMPVTFAQVAAAIGPAIDSLFDSSVDIIAEPGRFFVTSAYSLATQILSVRRRGPEVDYYISDGVYGSFKDACILKIDYSVLPLIQSVDAVDKDPITCNIFGPTQHPFDIVLRHAKLPRLSVGDWIFFPNMGAYTISLSTSLAGLPRPPIHYYNVGLNS